MLLIIACGSGDGTVDAVDPDIITPSDFGTIRGSVTSSRGIPLNAVHVRAVNVEDTDIQISTFSGMTSGFDIVDGYFEISFVPPGNYRVLIEKMDSRNNVFQPQRYTDFIVSDNPQISFPDEYFNGANEGPDDDPGDFVIINVTAGDVVSGIDFITND